MRAYQLRDSWDDLVQDVMITLLEHQPEAHDDASVAAYLRSVTTRRYFDLLRKEAGRRRNGGGASSGWRRNVPLEDAVLEPASAGTLDQRLEIDLERALERLEPRRRRILESKYALGCTDAEGAATVGEALGTYKRLLREALFELRQALLADPVKGRSHGNS